MKQQLLLLSLRDVIHKGHQAFSQHASRLHSSQTIYVTLSYIFFSLIVFLTLGFYPLDLQIFYVLFQILYICFTPYTF